MFNAEHLERLQPGVCCVASLEAIDKLAASILKGRLQ